MLKKTIFRQQKAFRDMDEAVDCPSTQATTLVLGTTCGFGSFRGVNEHKQLIKRFREELRQQDKRLEAS